LAEDVETGRK